MPGLLGARSRRLPLRLRPVAVEAAAAAAETAHRIKAAPVAAMAAVQVGPTTAVALLAAAVTMVMTIGTLIPMMILRTIRGTGGGTLIMKKVKKRSSPTLM